MPASARGLFGQGLRFLVTGAVNTLGTLVLYQLLLFVLPYGAAYAASWCAGLVFVNFAYPYFVYGRTAVSSRETALNSGYYVASFLASWGLLYLLTSKAGLPPRLSIFGVLAVIVPVNFLVTRYIYRSRAPHFVKPARVTGNRLVFRDATPADAAFILALRTDPDKSRHLSTTPNDLARQVAWLEAYARDDSQVYFIMEDGRGEAVGTVRLYDRQGDSFCWGSWIIKAGAPGTFAIESALMVYHFARELGFTRAHFNVRKDNASVWRFHERFGAVKSGETEDEFLYTLGAAAISASLEKYSRHLPQSICVTR